MDPASNALSLAYTVSQISVKLYLFCQDVKHNNQTVGDIAGEIRALSQAVESITTAIDNPNLRLQSDNTPDDDCQDLWASVRGPLSDTHSTLGQFQQLIKNVLPEAENTPKAVLRTIKLNMKKAEMESFRKKIQGHISVLNVSLQMLNLRAAYMSPNVIIEKILPAIHRLHALLDNIPPDMAERARKLRVAADKEMSSARTVSSRSDTGGSVMGRPLTPETREQTLSWIPSPEQGSSLQPRLSNTLRSSSFPLTSIFSPAPSESTAPLTNFTSNDSVSSADDDHSDPDEDFQVDLVSSLFEEGTKLYDEKRYTEAQSHLQKGVEQAEKLPVKRKDPKMLRKVEMMLATCACHSPNLGDAEKRLYAITQALPADDGSSQEDVVRLCTAMHLLSVVLFRELDYAAAKNYCRKAITARRKVLGSRDTAYFESIYLLHQIYLADGDNIEASAYLRMIPEAIQSSLVKVEDEYPGTPELLPSSVSAVEKSPKARKPSTAESPTAIGAATFPGLPEPALPLREVQDQPLSVRPVTQPVRPAEMNPATSPILTHPMHLAQTNPETNPTPKQPAPKGARTPSVASSVSSAASIGDTQGKRRSSVRDFFRRKSNPKSPNMAPRPDPAMPGLSLTEDSISTSTSPELQPHSMPGRPSPHERHPSESLKAFLLKKIEEETGHRPCDTEYPGLF